MRTSSRTSAAIGGFLLALVAACAEGTGPAPLLVLRPVQSSVTLSEAQSLGLVGTLQNLSTDSVTINAGPCMPNTATLDEWTGDGWREIPLESFAACALSLYVPITVAPGESATVTTGAHPPRGGRYRIRIATTRGEASSTAVEVH